MTTPELILEIAVPSPLLRSFDYLAPRAGLHETPRPGSRVLVPFGHRKVVGVLLAVRRHSDVPAAKLKPALKILDREPVLDASLMALLNWTARYYHHPIGETLATALPARLRKPGSLPSLQEQVWRLSAAGRQPDRQPAHAPRQAQVLERLAQQPQGLAREALPVPLAVLKTLQDKGWIECVEATPAAAAVTTVGNGHALTAQQQVAVEAVQAGFGKFQTFLLEGVTGSGKTEVYLRLIEPLLEQQQQVLVLVPEIGLTPQLIERFRQRFAVDIAVLHSGLNDSQRLRAWQRAASGDARLILGTRSAIFTPLKNPGLIIVDEEHDSSLKQQEGLRYSARDLAIWRARQLDIPILLGSATPSLESLYNVQQGRYRLLELPERAGSALAPRMRLLDLRGQGMRDLLSDTLLQAMRVHLANDGQILLFLNRRGFAPVLLCHACGWVAECLRCDARMTLHQQRGELRCHHCGSQRRIDAFCPACGSSELLGLGEGTERIEQALQEHFPTVPLLRIDRDTTRLKGELEAALNDAESGRARILLGTQMLAKGHHFPAVTLAAILDADQGLFSADFRASERLAQMIIQVAGRAGRADRPGEVMIQTHHPEHPLLRQLVESGYPAFARAALAERAETQLPPCTSMALLRADATQANYPRDFLEAARQLVEPDLNERIQLWGPVPAPMERRAGRYRAQLLVQSSQRADLQQLLQTWIPRLDSIPGARRVRWSIDVDPVDMY
ncbi:MAG TPA: primosomal protein N' [Gammaproteobacteria bacterium]|nr:primosomal protein N' [Gammaproteobacteria bacterium]